MYFSSSSIRSIALTNKDSKCKWFSCTLSGLFFNILLLLLSFT
uniref:Uncharacterized protein n=1 Tax=Schistosoma curassoni TaxID=6186 RepID=A0A183JJP8_9TREM